MRPIDEIYVHCAYTPPSMDIGRDRIDEWHRERGFNEIGYHYVIRRSGEIEFGRDKETEGAHVRGHNMRSLGICLVGGMSALDNRPDFNYTRAQLRILDELLTDLTEQHPDARVLGHRDTDAAKACPCFDVQEWWYEGAIQ